MIDTVRILIVEDDEDQMEAYRDAASDMETEEFRLEVVGRRSAEQAKEELLSRDFDGAIVDLNLSPGNPNEASGNDVLSEITARHRFPVFVVSGNLQNLAPDIGQSGFLKTFDRAVSNDVIFDGLIKIHKTGITKILGGRGLIEQHLGEIFWRHLSCDFDNWDAGGRDSERTLLRYAVTHLLEYLDLPHEEENSHYHEAEFYIIPPIRAHVATGDVVQHEGGRYIVLSPPCDVVVRGHKDGKPVINANSIVLAPLVPVTREAFLNYGIMREDAKSSDREKLLDEIVKGKREKYVFLPGYRNIDAAVADLQNILTWSLDDFMLADRLATVSGAFLKEIQSRFAAYYGRQGQPDLDKKELVKQYKKVLSSGE
ncbi:MAG: response regulator [Chromatiales bacterium]|nr:response regulator [Chromatiales bacterium]